MVIHSAAQSAKRKPLKAFHIMRACIFYMLFAEAEALAEGQASPRWSNGREPSRVDSPPHV